MAKITMGETAEVFFVDRATGVKTFSTEVVNVDVEYNYDEKHNKVSFQNGTRSASINLNSFSISLDFIVLSMGLGNDKCIKRLMYIRDKTNKKRTKNKLKKRILTEVSKRVQGSDVNDI
jgi:hypothetical protein